MKVFQIWPEQATNDVLLAQRYFGYDYRAIKKHFNTLESIGRNYTYSYSAIKSKLHREKVKNGGTLPLPCPDPIFQATLPTEAPGQWPEQDTNDLLLAQRHFGNDYKKIEHHLLSLYTIDRNYTYSSNAIKCKIRREKNKNGGTLPVPYPDPMFEAALTQSYHKRKKAKIISTHNMDDLHYNAKAYKQTADAMCELYRNNLTDTQNALLDETISLCKQLVETKELTVSNGITRIHDVLKYYMRSAFSTTSEADFDELVLDQCNIYYNTELFEKTIDDMCKNMKTYLSTSHNMVLDETILLHKHLVDAQDIIAAEGIVHVSDVLHHLLECSAVSE